MADPVTQNKGLVQPPNAADPGTWDVPMNANSHVLDTVLGGVTVLNAQGASGVVALTLAQYQAANIVVTGVPGGALTYQLPAGVGGFFFAYNLCTGANAAVSFGSASVAPVVTIPGSFAAVITIDPVYGGRRADSIDTEAAGATGQLQYNNNGVFAGAVGLTWNPTTSGLTIPGPLAVGGNFAIGGFMSSRLIIQGGAASTTPQAVAFSTGSMAVDCSLSNVFETTMTGTSAAPTFTNQQPGQTINWRLIQDGSGNRVISWPGSFRWPGGTAGVLSTGAGVSDLLVATWFASTATWLANLVKGFPA